MSVREEDKNKNSSTRRGLGLAAAAIGVGVGAAAAYYFLSKRPEQQHPDTSGSTSEAWRNSQLAEQTLNKSENDESGSYCTISEHSTTDTSMNEDSFNNSSLSEQHGELSHTSTIDVDAEDSEEMEINSDGDMNSDREYGGDTENSDLVNSEIQSVVDSVESELSNSNSNESSPGHGWSSMPNTSFSSPYENVTPADASDSFDTSLRSVRSLVHSLQQSLDGIESLFRNFYNRERSWSLEECPICFDIMLKDEQLLSLPCTHNFHMGCIAPWLEQRQTCPVCRKSAEC